MYVLDMHFIHNYPVSCLCRDENGSPKSFVFGGVERNKPSSQNLKRAIREYLMNLDKTHFGGIRMRSIASMLAKALVGKGMAEDLSQTLADAVANLLGKSEEEKTKTILFFSPGEIAIMAGIIVEAHANNSLKDIFTISEDKKTKVKSYVCQKGLLKSAKSTPIDIADIEIFGRMVASDPNLFVEGAASFSHPFSVHACEPEVDYFSAVDETLAPGASGAGHIGEIEFTAPCLYGCISIDLDVLNKSRLGPLPSEVRQTILAEVIEACVIAVPKARHNSMFAATGASAVLGLVRENTFPLSLANAYEIPIVADGKGYSIPARERLEQEWKEMQRRYGAKRLGVTKELWFPDVDLDTFITELAKQAMVDQSKQAVQK